jgi:hypothetical protein
VTTTHEKELPLQANTICDPAIIWWEIEEIRDETSKGNARECGETLFRYAIFQRS